MNRRGSVCILLGLALLLTALGLTGYNVLDEKHAGESAVKAYQQLRTRSIERGELELPEGILPAYQVAPQVEMPTIEIDGNSYIGYISIPSLGIDLPVMSDWSYPKMKIAPCRYWGSAYLDNMVIAAHNYVGHFGRLSSAAVGDQVTFTDVEGNVFEYVVSDMIQLWPGQSKDMVQGDDWDLTLFTCTTSGRQRFTVRCVRAEDAAS